MQVQQAVVMVTSQPVPLGQLVTTLLTVLLAGAFNLHAAHNMAESVRRSLHADAVNKD